MSSDIITELRANDVKIVACTLVDNAGITRVKCVPIERLESAAETGIGLSYVFAVFGVDDHITASPGFDTPSGDMRLIPDVQYAVALEGAPGWAWAPVDQYDQELNVMPICQRSLLKRLMASAADKDISFKMSYEMEFTLLDADNNPAHDGPGYSPIALLEIEPLAVDLVTALQKQGIEVAQFHPEYSVGQVELSLGTGDPLRAADQHVLARNTIRRIARKYGFNTSFAPFVLEGAVGNGCHLHFSAWQDGQNLMTGGNGQEGLTESAEWMLAGVLQHLPEMIAVYAPSPLSYARLLPNHWAGAYTAWGWENREAALRYIKGMVSVRDKAANLEIKTVDHTANPYLAAAMLIASAMHGYDNQTSAPKAIQTNPADLSDEEREANLIYRLPATLGSAIEKFEASQLAKDTMGDLQFGAYLASRRLEWDSYLETDAFKLAEMFRFKYG